MGFEIKAVNTSGIALTANESTVKISGNIDNVHPGDIMGPFLEEVHKQALMLHFKRVKLDITELSFLNSAGISEISQWVLKNLETPSNQQYIIDIFCDLNLFEWQYSTMKTLQLLNPELIYLH